MSTNSETPKATDTAENTAPKAKPEAAKTKPAESKAKPAATAAKPAAKATKAAASKATAAKSATKAEPAKEAAKSAEAAEGEGEEKVHVLEKMVDFSYVLATNIPLGGKYVKKVFDQYETKRHAKEFSNRFFKPFFFFPKMKK